MKILDFFVRWAVFLYFRSGAARTWSNLYSAVWERKTRETLRRFTGLGELVSYIRGLKWTADTWRQLWDATSSIEAIQWRASYAPYKLIGDCDEFGRYSACVIRNEIRDNLKWGGGDLETTFLLSVMWRKTGESVGVRGYGGHNVCLIRYRNGTWAYMDYGMPSRPRYEIRDVVRDVRDRYAQDCEPLGYAFSDPWTLGLVGISRE